ncbi:MAG: GNAT family N-acetyltransferase [Phycisphaeraceae bacterium]|nr:GNAT family N-acetyltransferase [Phycisphaerales bacterium]QOJ18823.1 MAG: GNAT family N-acetyltransferase [Phycisphaeraceae bacterium]
MSPITPTVLETDRLLLRPFTPEDAPVVQRYASDREVARTTLSIPHPYPDGAAAAWIAGHARGLETGLNPIFAITLREGAQLIGAIDLRLNPDHRWAEVGYVIYRPWWGAGYATEALRSVVRHGFETLGLHRIHAHHFGSNPASGRVLEKAGMRREGVWRQHICKWGEMLDVVQYGLLRAEWASGQL